VKCNDINCYVQILNSLLSAERSADVQLEVGWTVQLEWMLWKRENSVTCWEYNHIILSYVSHVNTALIIIITYLLTYSMGQSPSW